MNEKSIKLRGESLTKDGDDGMNETTIISREASREEGGGKIYMGKHMVIIYMITNIYTPT